VKVLQYLNNVNIFSLSKDIRLMKVNIVLVEPAGPLNVGSVARVMRNMGLSQLILVNPHCDHLGEESRKMAVHGASVLEQALIVSSLPEALQGCQRAIATTGRTCSLPTVLETPREGLPWLLEEGIESALIFGNEARGLNNTELNYAQRFVYIPANPEYPSLNLAQAVAVCAYELYQLTQEGSVTQPPQDPPCNLDNLERSYQNLETMLLNIGYLYPHTASARMEKLRRLFNRANLTQQELALLQGILSQLDWALRQKSEVRSQKSEVEDN